MGTGAGKTSKFSAIFLASVLLFSTVSIASLAGMTPLPTASAGGSSGGSLADSICNVTPISSDDVGDDNALTFWASQGVFLWATDDELYRLSVNGVKTSIDDMDHDTRGLAFSLDGNTLYSIEQKEDQLHIVDPTDASAVGSSTTITLEGKDVRGGAGLATHPTTGVLFALLRIEGEGRTLVTIDPSDGKATSIGSTVLRTAGIAFNSAGTLFAITGSGASVPNSIFTVNTSTAELTFVCSNGIGRNGSTIAFNPNDALLYLSLNDSQFVKFIGGFLTQCQTQNIPTNADRRVTAMTFRESVGEFLFTNFSRLFDLTVDGDSSSIGTITEGRFGESSKGLAFIGSTLYSLDRSRAHLHTVEQGVRQGVWQRRPPR